jgi:hypothetical protein
MMTIYLRPCFPAASMAVIEQENSFRETTCLYKIGKRSSRGLPFNSLRGMRGIVYPTIKATAFIEGLTYYTPLKLLQTLCHFYETTQSAEMPYTEGEPPYSSAKTVHILPDHGLRRGFSPFSTVRLVVTHLVLAAPHFTLVLAYPRTSSKLWADGLRKHGRFIFVTILLYVPNYSLRLSAFASIIDISRLLTFIFLHHLLPPHPTSAAYHSWFARTPIVNKSGSPQKRTPDFRYPTSNDAAEVVVTVSSRSEAGYEQFRRPLRLSKFTDPASPICYWRRQY